MHKLLKVLLLALYCFVILTIASLLVTKQKVNRFKSYTNSPRNDDITVNVQVFENRKSKAETENEHQYSSYDVYLSITKLNDGVISNMYSYICAESNGKFRYSETSNSRSMSEHTYIYNSISFLNTSSAFAYHEFIKNDDNSYNENDFTPSKFYVKVIYDIKMNDLSSPITKELNFKFDYEPTKSINSSSYEDRNVSGSIKFENDPIAIKMLSYCDEAKSADVWMRTLRLSALEAVSSNIPANTSISYLHLNICGVIDGNDIDKNFGNIINFFDYNGALEINHGIKLSRTVTFNDYLNIKYLYFTGKVELSNGVTKNIKYRVNINELPTE